MIRKGWLGASLYFSLAVFSAMGEVGDPYETLRVARSACGAQIESAFRNAIRELAEQGGLTEAEAQARRRELTEAWESLTLVDSRMQIDKEHRRSQRREWVEYLLELYHSGEPAKAKRGNRLAKELFQKWAYQLAALEMMEDALANEDDEHETLFTVGEFLERVRTKDPRFLKKVIHIVDRNKTGHLEYFTDLLKGNVEDPEVFAGFLRWLRKPGPRGRAAFDTLLQQPSFSVDSLIALAQLMVEEGASGIRATDLLLTMEFSHLSLPDQHRFADELWTLSHNPPFHPLPLDSLFEKLAVPESVQMKMVKDLEELPTGEHQIAEKLLSWISSQWTANTTHRLIQGLRSPSSWETVQRLLGRWRSEEIPEALLPHLPRFHSALEAIAADYGPSDPRSEAALSIWRAWQPAEAIETE